MDRPLPPPDIDLTDDRRATLVVTSFTTWVLAIIAISLRIVSRKIKRVELWIDDWLILAALPATTVHVSGMAGYAVSRGLGLHVWVTPQDSMRALALGLFIGELSYFFTLVCVKWSILAFYWRTFYIRDSIHAPIWTLATIVLLWGVAVISVTLFQCWPTHAFWSRFDPDHPLSRSDYYCGIQDIKFFYGNAIPNMVTDILMLILPTPYIYSLQLPTGQKLTVAAIFLVGIFVTLVSVIRLTYLLKVNLQDPDLTWSFLDLTLWSITEGNIAVVCACLPFLRPVLNKFISSLCSLFPVCTEAHQSDRSIMDNSNPQVREDIGRHRRDSLMEAVL